MLGRQRCSGWPALAAEHGYTLERVDAPTHGTVLTALSAAASLKGKLASLVAEAIADQRITANEARQIAEVCGDTQALLAQVAQHARTAAAQGVAA